jgi:hypothetical protein
MLTAKLPTAILAPTTPPFSSNLSTIKGNKSHILDYDDDSNSIIVYEKDGRREPPQKTSTEYDALQGLIDVVT